LSASLGPLQVGDDAPDFELRDQHGRTVRRSALRGEQAALIVFYPWAFTGVCGSELTALQQRLDDIKRRDVALLAISTDSMFALRAFADQRGLTFPLLSDFWPHGAVATSYRVFDQGVGAALRGTFLVDRRGVLRWSLRNDIGDARDVDDYMKAIAAL